MILDQFAHIAQYKGLGTRMAKAIRFLQENDLSNYEPGRYTIEGDEIFFMVNQYETKPESDCKPETHRKYIDIQYILEGAEKMGYFPLEGQTPSVEYNPTKDIEFFALKTDLFEVRAGMIAIFFTQDIHQPGVMVDQPKPVKKVVVKVLV
jgi:YhcH/YjgK/YiaL family protein